jgi:hypothetical protein
MEHTLRGNSSDVIFEKDWDAMQFTPLPRCLALLVQLSSLFQC